MPGPPRRGVPPGRGSREGSGTPGRRASGFRIAGLAPSLSAARDYRRETAAVREPLLLPDPEDPRLTQLVEGVDQEGRRVDAAIVHERPLTLFLNGQEIVTMMTIGDYPEYLAVGYLLNQNMLRRDDEVTAVDYDEELQVVVVRTAHTTDYQEKLQKKIR